MVLIDIKRNQEGQIMEFRAQGHAGYAEAGNDIVCAAVSAIIQTAIFGLTDYLDLAIDVDSNDGLLNCNLGKFASNREVITVLETMVVGLKRTAESYPDSLELTETQKGGESYA